MPIITCKKCGRTTNTAVAKLEKDDEEKWVRGNGCYAAQEGGRWQKGCIFEEADLATRKAIQRMVDRIDSFDKGKER